MAQRLAAHMQAHIANHKAHIEAAGIETQGGLGFPAGDVANEVELHEYQVEFLEAQADGISGIGSLLSFAAENRADWENIFRTVHCHRCDNEDGENGWRKSLHPVNVALPPAGWDFLNARVANVEGVELEETGPVRRAVKTTDKAVRCLIDWAVTKSEEGEDVSPLFADAAPIELELHDYHEEFLAEKRAQFGLADQTAPLRCLLNHAAANPDDWGAMFRTVHCHRCDTDDGLKENAWKKSKKPVSLQLLPEQIKFLIGRVNNEEGVELEAKGPVNRAVLDTGKAARCAMDWCITQEEAGEDVSWIFGGDVAVLQASL